MDLKKSKSPIRTFGALSDITNQANNVLDKNTFEEPKRKHLKLNQNRRIIDPNERSNTFTQHSSTSLDNVKFEINESSQMIKKENTFNFISKNANSKQILNKSSQTLNDGYLSNNFLCIPNSTQSTLKITGKPLKYTIKHFSKNSKRSDNNILESSIPKISNFSLPVTDPKIFNTDGDGTNLFLEGEKKITEDINVENDASDFYECTIPFGLSFEESTSDEDMVPFGNNESSNSKTKLPQVVDSTSTINESIWIKMKIKTDALKIAMEAQKKQQEAIEQKRECEKARIEAQLKQRMKQLEGKLKKQCKKSIDKAYYADGKLYKQPKLPIPQNWVTKRLYKYLWKCMEPKFHIRTRIKSEKFVVKLCDVFTAVTKRKRYENYKEDLDNLLLVMAKIGIIETRKDFYKFCNEFMPYSFRIKVIPMILPGNVRNVPFDPKLVNKPILSENSGICEFESDSDSCNEI